MTEYSGFNKTVSKKTILNAQNGDEGSLEEIYITYAQACFRLAYRILGKRDMAEDIVNSVFIIVIQKIANFNNSGSFAGWLRKIALNETLKHVQKLKTLEHRAAFLDDTADYEHAETFDHAWFESCNDLSKLTEAMSPQLRAVLYLHEIEGYSHKEIANMFNKTESFSKQSLSRAFLHMKNRVEKLGSEYAS